MIACREERVKTLDGVSLAMKDVTAHFIYLRKLFTKLFELPNVLSDTLSYMRSIESESDWLCNFVHGEVWKRKRPRFRDDDIVIPLNAYYDEFQPKAELGPHPELLGCTYVSVPVIPPESGVRVLKIFFWPCFLMLITEHSMGTLEPSNLLLMNWFSLKQKEL